MDTNKVIQRIAKAQTRTQIAEILSEVSTTIAKELQPIAGQIQVLQAQKEGIVASQNIIETFAQTKLNTLQNGGETTENED
jgi:uncharacterized protein YoxC